MEGCFYALRAPPVMMLMSSQGLSYLNEKGGMTAGPALAVICVQGWRI